MDRLLPICVVCDRLHVREADLLAWVERGEFPPPVVLPDGVPRWRLSEVREWLARAARRRRDADLARLSELARAILQALEEAAGEWVGGADLARQVGGEADHTSGSWKRATRELRQAGLIETDAHLGYRLLRPAGTGANLERPRCQD